MKQLIILLLISSSFNLFAQKQAKGFHLDKPVNMAAILAKKPAIVMGFSTVSEARSIINDIMDAVAIQQNFQVVSTAQVGNAAAVMYEGQRYILYNPSFINQLDNAANDKWASISVIGHEIGHHLLGHTMDGSGSQIPKELAADEFSGLVLRRMGASLQQAQLAMNIIGSPYASATHPAEQDRLVAIAKGWNSTSAQTTGRDQEVVINSPNDRRNSYPGGNTQTYPPARRTYPSTNGAGNRYPGTDSRNYPPTQDDRNSYPSTGRTYPSDRSGRNNYPGRSNRGNNTISQAIAYDIIFNGAQRQQYYITTQNTVVMIRGNNAQVVARVAATNRMNYPFVIYDDQQQILIDKTGNLLMENGRKVGYITRHL